MSGVKQKPTRWLNGLAALLPMLACGVTSLLVYRSVPKLPGALDNMGIENLTQVVVPGSAEIYFPKAGAYAVYYEYRSVIDGERFVRGSYPPGLTCQLKSKATGKDVELAASNAEGNIYTTQDRERMGQMINTISIDTPGRYLFSCQYAEGATAPEVVLAVGPNMIWEFFNVAAKPVAALLCGAAVFSGTLVLALLIVGFTAYSRHRSRASRPLSMDSHPQVCLRIRR